MTEGGNESRCSQKCEQLCFHSYLSLGNSTAKDNGREPNAPSPEAPRSALQEDASSRARLGACSMRSLALKIRGFLMRLAAEATQDSFCCFTYLIRLRHPAQSLLAGLSPASRSWIDFNLTCPFCPRLKTRSVAVLGHSNPRGQMGFLVMPASLICEHCCARGRAHPVGGVFRRTLNH